MKRIIKEEAPEWFEDWKQKFYTDNGKKAYYKDDFSTDTDGSGARRIRLRNNLLSEQGNICCYCMNRITLHSSHIEHFWPKYYFKEKDMEYENLFASCNGEGSMILDEEHCGHKKEDWWMK